MGLRKLRGPLLDTFYARGVAYGINTVVQRLNVASVPTLAELLLAQSVPPRWWHLTPVRGEPDLLPESGQINALRAFLPSLIERGRGVGIEVIAAPNMFVDHDVGSCAVPTFTAYVRSDTGAVYDCNMLAYGTEPIGNIMADEPVRVWTGVIACEVRAECGEAGLLAVAAVTRARER